MKRNPYNDQPPQAHMPSSRQNVLQAFMQRRNTRPSPIKPLDGGRGSGFTPQEPPLMSGENPILKTPPPPPGGGYDGSGINPGGMYDPPDNGPRLSDSMPRPYNPSMGGGLNPPSDGLRLSDSTPRAYNPGQGAGPSQDRMSDLRPGGGFNHPSFGGGAFNPPGGSGAFNPGGSGDSAASLPRQWTPPGGAFNPPGGGSNPPGGAFGPPGGGGSGDRAASLPRQWTPPSGGFNPPGGGGFNPPGGGGSFNPPGGGSGPSSPIGAPPPQRRIQRPQPQPPRRPSKIGNGGF